MKMHLESLRDAAANQRVLQADNKTLWETEESIIKSETKDNILTTNALK